MRPLVKKSSAGFTLLELSIVIVISGIIFIAFLNAAKSYIETTEQEKLTKVVESAKIALTQYKSAFGKYPCPARADLPRTDSNYGKADCTITPVGGVLTGILPRDKKLNILISSFETLQTNFMDPWDRPLIYAVTRNLSEVTGAPAFDINGGKIDIKDESGTNTGGIKGDAHFVVLSYGRDSICPATGLEAENCNGDEKFISSIRNDGPGADHFDDRIEFYVARKASLWSDHVNSAYATVGDAKNDNSGNIGIGTTLPTEKLSVVGDINASTKVMAQKICDDGTTNCMKPEALYSVKCTTNGQYITAVNLSATTGLLVPTCTALNFPPPATTTNCPHGVEGVFTDGTIKCAP